MIELTYVYCLVRGARPPSIDDAPRGMPGSRATRALSAGKGLWAIVGSVPARDYDEASLARGLQTLDWVGRHAMAHEAMVEFFLSQPALLPMQLFSLFTSDDRVLDHVRRKRRSIDRILSKLERQLEWGVRLTLDDAALRSAGAGRRKPPARSGVAYLAGKRDLIDATRAHAAKARTEAGRLYRQMSGKATAARRRRSTEQAAPGSRLLLDAAFLVPSRRARSFRAALTAEARRLQDTGIVMALTGPWPAYNFIDG